MEETSNDGLVSGIAGHDEQAAMADYSNPDTLDFEDGVDPRTGEAWSLGYTDEQIDRRETRSEVDNLKICIWKYNQMSSEEAMKIHMPLMYMYLGIVIKPEEPDMVDLMALEYHDLFSHTLKKALTGVAVDDDDMRLFCHFTKGPQGTKHFDYIRKNRMGQRLLTLLVAVMALGPSGHDKGEEDDRNSWMENEEPTSSPPPTWDATDNITAEIVRTFLTLMIKTVNPGKAKPCLLLEQHIRPIVQILNNHVVHKLTGDEGRDAAFTHEQAILNDNDPVPMYALCDFRRQVNSFGNLLLLHFSESKITSGPRTTSSGNASAIHKELQKEVTTQLGDHNFEVAAQIIWALRTMKIRDPGMKRKIIIYGSRGIAWFMALCEMVLFCPFAVCLEVSCRENYTEKSDDNDGKNKRVEVPYGNEDCNAEQDMDGCTNSEWLCFRCHKAKEAKMLFFPNSTREDAKKLMRRALGGFWAKFVDEFVLVEMAGEWG
ncbi:hypothetical protein MKZ38_010404 [Zalerion maritima]|uniref:Uncharacterized protein n=1 Tax=Zalerion maritima TaxID=339359 RepID=A0AAD5S0Q0_9PEZI|nr:hypothetical protein MKZ38_010404 [Zalerion maritima]